MVPLHEVIVMLVSIIGTVYVTKLQKIKEVINEIDLQYFYNIFTCQMINVLCILYCILNRVDQYRHMK